MCTYNDNDKSNDDDDNNNNNNNNVLNYPFPGRNLFQIQRNMVKNPSWHEANQLTIYKRGRGVELGATELTPDSG